MAKDSVFTMKLETGLRDAFMMEASAVDRPASQVARELMRDYVERQRETREHAEYLQRKVDVARSSARAGLGRSNEDVETDFAAPRMRSADS